MQKTNCVHYAAIIPDSKKLTRALDSGWYKEWTLEYQPLAVQRESRCCVASVAA